MAPNENGQCFTGKLAIYWIEFKGVDPKVNLRVDSVYLQMNPSSELTSEPNRKANSKPNSEADNEKFTRA